MATYSVPPTGGAGGGSAEYPIYGSSRLGLYKDGRSVGVRRLGTRQYELSNHLGNVLSVITDNIRLQADSAWATVANAGDYYAFGGDMPGRAFTSQVAGQEGAYRYGFNGKEHDTEETWGSTTYDYGFRIYNPRYAKFLSVDPLTASYPWYTPYQFAGNMPIEYIDLDGLEPAKPGYVGQNETAHIKGEEEKGYFNWTYSYIVKQGQKEIQTDWIRGEPVKMDFTPILPPKLKMTSSSSNKPLFQFGNTTVAPDGANEGFLSGMTFNLYDNFSITTMHPFNEVSDFDFDQLYDNDKGRLTSSYRIGQVFGAEFTGSVLGSGIGLGVNYLQRFATLDVKEIFYMQNNMKNSTGNWTVIENAESLANGTLKPNTLRINVWRDLEGKIWTLDHRRLGAFELSGLQRVPVKWTDGVKGRWKFTTQTGGRSIDLKFSPGVKTTIKK